MKKDRKITRDIVNKLFHENFEVNNIQVGVQGGIVELTGTVPHIEERHRAARVTKEIADVIAVKNHIAVMTEPVEKPIAHVA